MKGQVAIGYLVSKDGTRFKPVMQVSMRRGKEAPQIVTFEADCELQSKDEVHNFSVFLFKALEGAQNDTLQYSKEGELKLDSLLDDDEIN